MCCLLRGVNCLLLVACRALRSLLFAVCSLMFVAVMLLVCCVLFVVYR